MSNAILPSELQTKLENDSSLKLIDVRTPAEYNYQHATHAINVPLNEFDAKAVIERFSLTPGKPVYMICKMGGRSQKACNLMIDAGLSSVVNVTGGTDRWVAEGLPSITEGKKPFAVNRQVQILSGSLVLTGVLLSLVNPWFILLSAFIGCGLVFSGLTDTCGMGTVLASMPWNQTKKTKAKPEPKAAPKPTAELETVAKSDDEACDTGG